MDYKEYKKRRGSDSDRLEKLQKAVDDLAGPTKKSYEDPRFWQCERDKTGNGYAEIRFLPATDMDDAVLPIQKLYTHFFKNEYTGKWFVENCLTTIGKKDPATDYAGVLWRAGQQDESRKYKRLLHYVANVLIIDDPLHPENNGTVRLFKFGQKIYDKMVSALKPPYPKDPRFDPFDPEEGADFILKIKTIKEKSGTTYPNYDESRFATQTPLLGGSEKKISEVFTKLYPLKPFVAPSEFKTYEELKAKLDDVFGFDTSTGKMPWEVRGSNRESSKTMEDEVSPSPKQRASRAPSPRSKPEPVVEEIEEDEILSTDDADSDSDMDFFNTLGGDDDTPF